MDKDMKTYKNPVISVMLLSVLLFCGCTANEVPSSPGSISFDVCTRASASLPSAPDDEVQYTCLYVAERLQEHAQDNLHCAAERRYSLTGGTYRVANLFGQWYRFAFVCVPKLENGGGKQLLTEEKPEDRTCDYGKLMIDFAPVIRYQKANVNVAVKKDINIYRRVIDRWIDPDVENAEDVELTRMTGELVVDMGIPADQFPDEIELISLTLRNLSNRVYIRDEARDEVITVPGNDDIVFTIDFSGLSAPEYAVQMKTRQQFRICLLPGLLVGDILVKYRGSNGAVNLPIGEEYGGPKVEIRKNRVTTVLYNGMLKDEFEVRYAGFDAGNDAEVDVDDDKWDGWQQL